MALNRNIIIFSEYSMQTNHQPTPQKISIAKLTQDPYGSFNSRPIPSLPNHITWQQQQEHFFQEGKDNTKKVDKPKRRRKIFQKYDRAQSKSKSQTKAVKFSGSIDRRDDQKKQLQKVKSSNTLVVISKVEEQDLQSRLLEINRKIAQHKQSKVQISLTCSPRRTEEEKLAWSKVEQKLTESTVLMRRQEEVLNSKIPSFQQKLQANNHAIGEISQLIQTKFEQSSHNMSKMMEMANKSESRLKVKEEQLSRINSQLLYKELQLMRNKQQNRKRQLQLIRMKRIEDLQNKNLQLYQSIQKQSFRQFEDLVVEENQGVIEGQVWEDQDHCACSKFSMNQQSTIKYVDCNLNTSRSANNTLGQILSPLALGQYQY